MRKRLLHKQQENKLGPKKWLQLQEPQLEPLKKLQQLHRPLKGRRLKPKLLKDLRMLNQLKNKLLSRSLKRYLLKDLKMLNQLKNKLLRRSLKRHLLQKRSMRRKLFLSKPLQLPSLQPRLRRQRTNKLILLQLLKRL